MAKNNSDNPSVQILHETIYKGLKPIAEYIEGKIKQKVYITDFTGHLCHPLSTDSETLRKEGLPSSTSLLELFSQIEDNSYYYQEETKFFCYASGNENIRAYVIIISLPEKALPAALSAIEDTKLALDHFFISAGQINNSIRTFEKEIVEYFFKKGSMHFATLFKFCDADLDWYKRFFVSITHITEIGSRVNRELIRVYTQDYFRRTKEVVLPIISDDDLLMVIPEVNKKGTFEVESEWPKLDEVHLFNDELEARFNITTATGIGGVYPLEDLDKSYREARIALSIPKLLGKISYIQRYSRLGVFTMVFSDIDRCRSYYQNFLKDLIEYDQKNGGELVLTLQTLVTNSFNHKVTASKLFIHVNTLHYRISKISSLLNVDFSNIENMFDIYLSVMIYSTLKENNWL